MDRRKFLEGGAVFGGALAALGPFQALSTRIGSAHPLPRFEGYGPLVNKGDLWLPSEFNYQIISVQGDLMSDGNPTPGIFDGMAAYRGHGDTTVLIRNHENRERTGEQKVLTPSGLQYNPLAFGGNTKLEIQRKKAGRDPLTGRRLYQYEVLRDFAILGGTSTNCAGGIRSGHIWITCEEVVKRLGGKKHGYIFEIDSRSNVPVPAIPVPQAGRRAHEAAVESAGIVYMTEDRSITTDPLLGSLGACFYRYVPRQHERDAPLHQTQGILQGLKLRDEFHANMNAGRLVGVPYRVEWVTIEEPDHEDDTDDRRDRVSGFTPNRVRAQDKGAAYFNRLEGMWVDDPGRHDDGDRGRGRQGNVLFDTTSGGPAGLGQVWEYNPRRETLTLIYEGTNAAQLQNPDNVVVVPQTGDVFLQEDGDGEQFVRGVTREGEIYDFARTALNDTEFCGGCFDPDGKTFYLNQQGDRGTLPNGPANARAVTYAIYGPFGRRVGVDDGDD